ncbi:hypothetical protein HBN83_20525 [Pseudomonas fragi]|uniref:hypothetical protein n=1 Tax=Pseudomonas fragi TaxID=296 RepID=UPI001474B498|nr:hypothetical protein [Pseudomonas fragi]NNB08290.1 hypothetical protein [Pseudomonas fragi]
MNDLQAKVSAGDHKGKPLYPHLHKDGKYVASPTRFEIDYIRVDELDELEVLVRSGYAVRMSNPDIPNAPSLIITKNIHFTEDDAVLTPAELLPGIIDQVDLDRDCISKARKEQAFLRAHLLRGSVIGKCVICHNIFPVDMLVAAHLKMRSACNKSERRDIDNVAALMCKTGCDDLYERGYISVEAGRVISTNSKTVTPRLSEMIANIEGLTIANWASSSYYYDWHRKKTAR